MRVAVLVHAFPVLSETFILNQIAGLLDAGHDVDIHASAAGKTAKLHPDVGRYRLLERVSYRDVPGSPLRRVLGAPRRVVRAGGWRRPAVLVHAMDVRRHGRTALSLGLLYASLPFLGRAPYDIVHCQFGTLAPMAAALRDIGALRGRLVVAFRGSDLTARRRSADYRAVFRAVDLVLPVCETFKDQLVALGCAPDKIEVHHSGITLAKFPFRERRRHAAEPTRVVSIGRLIDKKGLAYAIQAVGRVKASGRAVRYTIVGDGPQRDRLERMVAEAGLGADVELAGARSHDEVIALLAEAHLLMAPSVTADNGDQEGIPNVLKEAMALGVTPISTRHSGIPELIEDGVSGLLAPERDVDALAAHLTYLVDHPDRWPEMGRAGRRRIEAAFDSDRLNTELIALYRRIADVPSGPTLAASPAGLARRA